MLKGRSARACSYCATYKLLNESALSARRARRGMYVGSVRGCGSCCVLRAWLHAWLVACRVACARVGVVVVVLEWVSYLVVITLRSVELA